MAAHQAPRPWDSPGKNTGVGCHFLLQCMKVKSESEVTQSYPTPSDPMDCPNQAPLSMGFSRQEYWSGLPLPSPQHPPLLYLKFQLCHPILLSNTFPSIETYSFCYSKDFSNLLFCAMKDISFPLNSYTCPIK